MINVYVQPPCFLAGRGKFFTIDHKYSTDDVNCSSKEVTSKKEVTGCGWMIFVMNPMAKLPWLLYMCAFDVRCELTDIFIQRELDCWVVNSILFCETWTQLDERACGLILCQLMEGDIMNSVGLIELSLCIQVYCIVLLTCLSLPLLRANYGWWMHYCKLRSFSFS